MNELNQNADETRLRALLRESRPVGVLPPRFQENVWRRIEQAEAGQSAEKLGWLDSVAGWFMRPKLALAAVAVLVLIGAFLGVREGIQTARDEAQTRYLTAVAPNVLR
jgi:hypothetical protein